MTSGKIAPRGRAIRYIALAAVIILGLMLLSACGKEEAVSEHFSSDDSEMKNAFQQAEMVYSWFAGCGELDTDSDSAVDVDGDTYILVTQEGVSSTSELGKYANRFFTPQLADSLMNTKAYDSVPLFRDIDGRLYIFSSDTGLARRDIGECVGSVTSSTDVQKVYSVDMTYQYYNESVSAHFDYIYVLCEDGRWRFSTFELPAVLLSNEMFG